MYQYVLSLLGNYVEISSYLCKDNLYGKIISVTPLEVGILRDPMVKNTSDDHILYIPLSLIISLKKL